MRTRFRFVIAFITCMSLGRAAFAGSLFQRLPEPGRWCRYRSVLLPIIPESQVVRPEQRGTVTVSALAIVEHDGAPHQWIEISNSIEVPAGDADKPPVAKVVTYKCLIQRDQLQAGGDPLGHIVRGWLKLPGSEPNATDVESFSAEGPEALLVRFVMSGPLADEKPVSVPNSATINDETLETSTGFTGTLEPTEIAKGLTIDGEFSYWTHDSAGFGVLASEFLLNVHRSLDPKTSLEMQLAAQLELEE